MAHYAQLDNSSVVINVITGNDEPPSVGGIPGTDLYWEKFYTQETGIVHIKTSYNTHCNVHTFGKEPFRKNFAGIGYTYDADRDAFIPPKPYPSWNLNEDTCTWKAPFPVPDTNNLYMWNEEKMDWDLI